MTKSKRSKIVTQARNERRIMCMTDGVTEYESLLRGFAVMLQSMGSSLKAGNTAKAGTYYQHNTSIKALLQVSTAQASITVLP